MRRSTVAAWLVFAAVTLLIWVGRVRNIADDADLTAGGRAWRLALAASFLAGGAAVAGVTAWAFRRGGAPSAVRSARRTVAVVAAWTTAVWLVRATGIALDPSHSSGFKVVHGVLAAVSIGLALLAWRAPTDPVAGPPGDAADPAPGRSAGYAAARHGSADRRH